MSVQPTIVPAQLSYLAIYNPDLGRTDETVADQIVFYTSRSELERKQNRKGKAPIRSDDEATIRNEQLRQVGLAQGLVNFTRDFSDDEPASSVDTDKSRLIIHELEAGWWILACVDLTQIISKPAGSKSDTSPSIEYTSRELAPAGVLLSYLVKKHSTFLLHNGNSLSELHTTLPRKDFCSLLNRFWIRAAWLWDVLLRGNPAVDAYGGIRIAAGGELGVGVGEEERGSGEREVLEGLVYRTEGLVDLFVTKFIAGKVGEEETDNELSKSNSTGLADGMIFTGLGEVSRTSLRDIAFWMEDLSEYGRHAYGIVERVSKKQKHKRAASMPVQPRPVLASATAKNIPQPLQLPIRAAENASERSSGETVLHYLTLGYGSSWMGKETKPSTSDTNLAESKQTVGQFLVGLRGDAEDEASDEEARDENKISSHSIYVDMKDSHPDPDMDSSLREKMSIVVYVQAPFVFLLLFKQDSPILKSTSFYRSLHHQLGPLQRPLLRSTIHAAESTLQAAFLPEVNGKLSKDRPIYTMLHDPQTLTTLSTLPNIPEPPLLGQQQVFTQSEWSRADALQIHQLLLSTIASTRTAVRDMERTTKTSRGWWVVWMRLPPSAADRREGSSSVKEAILVRKSSGSDDGQLGPREVSSGSVIPRWGIGNVGLGARGMVEGIGVDVRGYVEGLLRLTR